MNRLIVIIVLLLASSAWSTAYYIESDDLPLTLSSIASPSDTIRFGSAETWGTGLRLTTATNGIYWDVDDVTLQASKDSGVTRDSLGFGTDYSDNRYGIRVSGIGIEDPNIYGLVIFHDVDSTTWGVSGSDTAYGCDPISIVGVRSMNIHRCKLVAGGFQAACFADEGGQSVSGIDFFGTVADPHLVGGYGNRESAPFAINITQAYTPDDGDNDFVFHFDSSTVFRSAYGGIKVTTNWGVSLPDIKIINSSINVDARNYYYDTTGADEDFLHSAANAIAIEVHYGDSDLAICDNRIYTEGVYWGCDIAFAIDDNTGTATDNWEIHDNVIVLSRGWDNYYNVNNNLLLWCKVLNLRQQYETSGGYGRFYNNVCSLLVDNDATTSGVGTEAAFIQTVGGGTPNTNVLIDSNTVWVIMAQDTGHAQCKTMAFNCMGGTFFTNGTYATNNTFYTSHHFANFGDWLASCSDNRVNISNSWDTANAGGELQETWTSCATSTGGSNYILDPILGDVADSARDTTYCNTGADAAAGCSLCGIQGDGPMPYKVGLRVSYELRVLGNNEHWVESCTTLVKDAYGQTWISDITGSDGFLVDTINYYTMRSAGDSAYNPFTIITNKGSEVDTNQAYIRWWEDAQNDTISLSIAGDGDSTGVAPGIGTKKVSPLWRK